MARDVPKDRYDVQCLIALTSGGGPAFEQTRDIESISVQQFRESCELLRIAREVMLDRLQREKNIDADTYIRWINTLALARTCVRLVESMDV